MENIQKWKFSEIPSIEESTFNKVLEKFYNLGIQGLTKENIQNSLDGKLPESSEPVIVSITLGKIKKREIPGIQEIEERIEVLQGRNSYTKDTITHMFDRIKKSGEDDEIDYISFEDSNTKGLTGAQNGQSNDKNDTWGIYAYNKGVHFEESDSEVEQLRGGSHGLGKIASNAASEIHLMYFANCDAQGNKHLGGTVQLIEHKYKDHYYRSTGYFTDISKSENGHIKFYPFENKFSSVFSKDTRGLKIIIPFLREQFNDEKALIKTICDNFFVAIDQERLIVVVNGKNIDKETLSNYIYSSEYYSQQKWEDIKEEFTPLYYYTYKNQKPQSIEIMDKSNSHRFNLYFLYNETIARGRLGIIRTIGMKIEDKKITGNVTKPFNALIIPDTIVVDAYLKSLENESHTAVESEHIRDIAAQKSAKKFITNISKKLAEIIDQAIRTNNPTDGIMDTKDILYVIESQFSKELAATSERVKINNRTTTLLKVGSNNEGKKRLKKKKQEKKNEKADINKEKKQREKPKNYTRTNEQGEVEKAVRYATYTDMVERIIIGNQELIRFDFSEIPSIMNAKRCNISLVLIDGMGNECDNEFNVKDSYLKAMDKSNNTLSILNDNLIQGLEVVDGIVELVLTLTPQYNKALKFIYYVEAA